MIRAGNVTVRFKRGPFRKEIRALDGFDLHVERGEIFGLLGPNGAGKSTAMYCFLGLIRPDKGEVLLAGARPEPGSESFRRVAYLPEEPHYHLYLSVEEALSYYGSLYGTAVSRARVDEVLERVGLADHRDLRLSKCSKGMKQKAGIAACMLVDSEILFLDEPTRGLDPLVVREFRDILLEMNRRGTTIVVNSHMLSEVEALCTRVAVIDRGRVVACDSMENIVKVDRGLYVVETDAAEPLPTGLAQVATLPNGRLRGDLPAEELAGFVSACNAQGVTIYGCSLKRLSLEDAFLDILKEGRCDV